MIAALISARCSNGQSLLGVVLGVENSENILRLLTRLKIDLLNRHTWSRTNSLIRIKGSLILDAINVVTWNVDVLGEDILELVPYVLIVRNVLVRKTLEMVENVLHLLHILCGDPKFLFRVV